MGDRKGTKVRVRAFVVMASMATGGLVLVAAPQPAGATVTASSSGTIVSVGMTGDDAITFRCASGKLVIDFTGGNVIPTPAVNCSALTQVSVTGDVGKQIVDGTGLDGAAFTAHPKLNVGLTTGNDRVTETLQADSLDLGNGSDRLTLRRGTAANTLLDLGAGGFDETVITGSDAADTLGISSSSANVAVGLTPSGSSATNWTIKDGEYLYGYGGKGNDTLSSTAVLGSSLLAVVTFEGEDGNDTMSAGAKSMNAHGGSGTNTFNLGASTDQIYTDSDTDVVHGSTDGVDDLIVDSSSLRFGGRTVDGFGNSVAAVDTYSAGSQDNDVTVRIRPGSSGTALETFSLNRMGQQPIPAGIEEIGTSLSGLSPLAPRTLADIVAPGQDVTISGSTTGNELIDITIPTGSWSESVGANYRTFTTAAGSVGNVLIPAASPFRVHGPWTNANQSFSHRVFRDVLLRFGTSNELTTTKAALDGGTSRAAVVQGIIDTDEYRGRDVDRVFLRYLRRAADSGGRTYWIGSIRNGKSLRQFRAQLFGSSEYFAKAGGTNAAFVTRAYEDVLGRKPDPSGQAYWTNKANNGTERGLIARQFLSSSEAKRAIIRDQFLRFLDRQPTAGELSTWSSALDSSANGEQSLVAFLAGSGAYYTRT